MRVGARNLITDVSGLLVGHAQDAALKSGVTVVTADAPFTAAVHVMGGGPGTRETDLLAPENTVEKVDALVLSGGSAFGLAAASGVADALRRAGRGFVAHGQNVPIVPGAIVFDLANGGNEDWGDNPYPALGAAALADAGTDCALGTIGAGTGATTQNLKGGLGSASFKLDSGITVAALVVVNAMGSATVGDSAHFWAGAFEQGAEFGGLGPSPATGQVGSFAAKPTLGTATTIAIVATDAALTKSEAKRVAIAAHDGIGRAVLPAHTPLDGDLVFAAATGARPLGKGPIDVAEISHAAALCLARAIARGVYLASPAPGDLLPTWTQSFSA
ncbi:MAG: P1 family peptidase [Alphaproteobacteria bacterium]|nr:P1 family peptidase [Alphaproteobacteria bacterium]MBT8477145.1 P1 family peptidase [Alphaproteobacteria bacterium]